MITLIGSSGEGSSSFGAAFFFIQFLFFKLLNSYYAPCILIRFSYLMCRHLVEPLLRLNKCNGLHNKRKSEQFFNQRHTRLNPYNIIFYRFFFAICLTFKSSKILAKPSHVSCRFSNQSLCKKPSTLFGFAKCSFEYPILFLSRYE